MLLERLESENRELLAMLQQLPAVALQQLMQLCIIDEVKATNDIEGVYSTRREIKDVLQGDNSSLRLAGIVRKYQRLLQEERLVLRDSRDLRRLYDEFVRGEVVAANPDNELDGELFRRHSVDVTNTAGKVLHRGVFPEEKIIAWVDEALAMLHNEELPFLVRVAVFHYLLAYIHPFYDGNGRTDRFISSCSLAEKYSFVAALRLSVSIKRQRKRYYRLFQDTGSVFNRGDLTGFVNGFASMIVQAFKDTNELLARKLAQLEKYQEIIMGLELKDDLEQKMYFVLLQAALFQSDGITMEELQRAVGKSRATVQKRLDGMKAGWLIVLRGRQFRYRLNLLRLRDL